jgi:hypothetical protein
MFKLIQFTVSAQRPTAGDDVQSSLEARIARARARASRQFWVHWIARRWERREARLLAAKRMAPRS